MSEMSERICASFPEREMSRRWTLVRNLMAEEGLDALVVQGANNCYGNRRLLRWFTDISAQGCYPHTIIFPKDDLMTLVFNGAEGGREELDGKTDGAAGIGLRITSPAFRLSLIRMLTTRLWSRI